MPDRAAKPRVVKGMESAQLTREEFERRFRGRFYDPLFDAVDEQIGAVVEAAWRSYSEYHKSPRTRKAGPGFADPSYELRSTGRRARRDRRGSRAPAAGLRRCRRASS